MGESGKPLSVIMIHGIGMQRSSFADPSKEWIRRGLYAAGYVPVITTVHWAPIMERYEEKIIRSMLDGGGNNSPMRRLAVNVLADATAYRAGTEAAERILECAINEIQKADDRGIPLVVLAHSLGALIALDAFRCVNPLHLIFLGSMGANIPLFFAGQTRCIIPPAYDVRWVNYFDPDDFLGFPLKGMFPAVEDRKVNVGNIFTWWNGFSHLGYWDDRQLWKIISRDVVATVSH